MNATDLDGLSREELVRRVRELESDLEVATISDDYGQRLWRIQARRADRAEMRAAAWALSWFFGFVLRALLTNTICDCGCEGWRHVREDSRDTRCQCGCRAFVGRTPEAT